MPRGISAGTPWQPSRARFPLHSALSHPSPARTAVNRTGLLTRTLPRHHNQCNKQSKECAMSSTNTDTSRVSRMCQIVSWWHVLILSGIPFLFIFLLRCLYVNTFEKMFYGFLSLKSNGCLCAVHAAFEVFFKKILFIPHFSKTSAAHFEAWLEIEQKYSRSVTTAHKYLRSYEGVFFSEGSQFPQVFFFPI